MPLPMNGRRDIPTQDIVSYVLENPQYDVDRPVSIFSRWRYHVHSIMRCVDFERFNGSCQHVIYEIDF